MHRAPPPFFDAGNFWTYISYSLSDYCLESGVHDGQHAAYRIVLDKMSEKVMADFLTLLVLQ